MFDANNLEISTWYLLQDNRRVFVDGLSCRHPIVYLYDPTIKTKSGLYTQDIDDFCCEVIAAEPDMLTGFRLINRCLSKDKPKDSPSKYDLEWRAGKWVKPKSPHTAYDDHTVYITREENNWTNLEKLSRNTKLKVIGNVCCITTINSERAYLDNYDVQYRFVGLAGNLYAVVSHIDPNGHTKFESYNYSNIDPNGHTKFESYNYSNIDVYIPPKVTPCKKKLTKKK